MRERFYYLPVILLLVTGVANGQSPVIQKIEPVSSFPNARILISGSGFSATPSQLQVWFDHVRGNIISSTNLSIEVEVPAQARLANVTVFNTVTRLSAMSRLKFMPVFSGEGFDPTKLTAPLSIVSSNAIFDIVSVDIDGDNKPDLVGSKNEATATSMVLLMNQSTIGNISFVNSNLAALTINAPTGHLAAGDLNGDGRPDVVASRSGSTSNTVFVLENKSSPGNPDFAAPLILVLDIIQGAREVGIADLNGDGKPEIVVNNSATNDIYIFKNESTGGTLNINPTPVKVTVTGATETLALELQDMDGDGKIDMVVTRNQNPDIYLLKNTSTLSSFTFSNITKISLPGQYNDLATADFNRDGKMDIVATSLFTNQAQVLLNKSTSTAFSFDAPISLATDAQPFGIDVSDLNGDRFPDFIIASRGAKTLNAHIHNGSTSSVGFTKVTIASNKTNWFVRAGDLDGDAKPDIAFTSFTGTTGPFSVDILRNMNCHKPQILNDPPLTICASQNIRLLTIPVPAVTFDWSNGFSSIKNSADPFVIATVAATYMVTARGENGACMVTSGPITIASGAGSVPTTPVITTNAPLCVGATLTLSTPAVSGATYQWKGPNNFTASLSSVSIPGVSIANAGIYSLTVKVGDCSSNTVTQRVDIVSAGNFSVTSSSAGNTLCQGQSLTLTVNSETGYTYQWVKDGTNISGQTTPTLTVNQDGSYKVKVSNTSLGCTQETSAIAVTVYVTPVASFTVPASGCLGNVISFTNISVVDLKVTAPVFLWEFGDNTTSPLKDPTITYTTAQSYNVKLTVSYSGVTGCTSSVTKSINIATGTVPSITTTRSELCGNKTETATLAVPGNFTSYLWSTTATTSSIDITDPGDYSVNTVDPIGCKGTKSIKILEKAGCQSITELEIPVVFTPNGDSQNDFWVIPGVEIKGECTMNVFDGRGRKVLEKKGFPIGGWNGVSDEGKDVPKGTYFYVFSCPDGTPVTGSVLIVR